MLFGEVAVDELYFCLFGSEAVMVGIHHDGGDGNVRLDGRLLHFLSTFDNLKHIGVVVLSVLVYILVGLGITVDDGFDVVALLVNVTFFIANHNLFPLEDHVWHLNFYDPDALDRYFHNLSLLYFIAVLF